MIIAHNSLHCLEVFYYLISRKGQFANEVLFGVCELGDQTAPLIL